MVEKKKVLLDHMLNKRLLVVDDDPSQLRLTRTVMSQFGFKVETACNGSEALEKIKQSPPDLILSDILMPVMDGFKLCIAVKQNPKLRHIPIVLASSNFVEKEDHSFAVSTGASSLAMRTPDFKEVIEALLLALDSEKMGQNKIEPLNHADGYEHRIIRQLERQAAMNATLSDRARIFMESANDGIFVTDLQGKLLEVNKKGLEMYQRPASQVIGHNYAEFIPAHQEKSTATEYQKATEGAATIARNIGLSRPDGSIIEIDFSSSVVQIGGEKLLFSVGRDVTERNRLQQISVQSEKLATMGTLTAGIAHEINNPLSYVSTNIELLSDCMSKVTPESFTENKAWIEKSLKQIKEGVQRVKMIASDLKVFSRSRDTEKDSILELDPILESSINMAAHEIKYRARIEKNFGKVSPVKAHEGRLGQVFLNLLINAAQAIPEGNTNGNEISVTTTMRSGRVAIDIKDTGTGIAPEVMKRLFTPFFTTKPVGLGTGLGLSICQNIIRGFGGEITVESQVGHGTTFHIFLPVSEEKIQIPKQLEPEKKTSKASQRGRVLIIDDEPDIAEVFGQVLSQDHDVVVMTNGREAFELLLKDNNFDAILSDLTMPDMAGIDIYNELRRLKNGIEERIAFVTGGVFTQRAQEFLKGVPNKCIEKPIENKALRSLVQELVQKRSSFEARGIK